MQDGSLAKKFPVLVDGKRRRLPRRRTIARGKSSPHKTCPLPSPPKFFGNTTCPTFYPTFRFRSRLAGLRLRNLAHCPWAGRVATLHRRRIYGNLMLKTCGKPDMLVG